MSLIGLFLFEGGSAQFAGGFIISISSMVPGGFYLASFAMMGFLRRVLNYLSSTWNDFWYRNRSWCNRICVVIPKGTISTIEWKWKLSNWSFGNGVSILERLWNLKSRYLVLFLFISNSRSIIQLFYVCFCIFSFQ